MALNNLKGHRQFNEPMNSKQMHETGMHKPQSNIFLEMFHYTKDSQLK